MHVIDILNIVIPVLYGIAVILYGISFFRKREPAANTIPAMSRIILILIILLQLIYFLLRSFTYGHAPITTPFEILTLLSFSLTVTYLYIEMRTRVKNTGFFILLMAGILQLISSVFIEELMNINPVLRNWLLGFHVSFALIGYSAITVSGIYGLLYLLLYHNIKSNRLGAIYSRLPSLQLLERLSGNAIIFGFVFLSLTILIGMIWLPRAIENFSYSDPKLLSTVLIWFIYATVIVSKRFGKLQGKTIMRMAFYGFIFAIFSVAIVNIFFSSFHRFN